LIKDDLCIFIDAGKEEKRKEENLAEKDEQEEPIKNKKSKTKNK